MFLSDLSVRRPVFAWVISLVLIVIGIISFTRLPLREYPDIDSPVVSVRTVYPGASAAVVESKVTQVIEDRIAGIEGIRFVESVSADGVSAVTIEFNLRRDIDSAANDVRDRVARVLDRLPEEVDPPEVAKQDADNRPILWLNLGSDNLNTLELTDYADRFIVDRLSVVDGVARVIIGGERRYAMRVWLDRIALAARDLTVTDIEDALRRENVELPAGRIESVEREFNVRVARNYQTEGDFRELVVGRGADGYLVRLGEVARVEVAAADDRSELRGNGQNMVGLGIIPQSTANTLDVSRGIFEEFDRIQATLPEGTQLYESYDSTIFVNSAIREVWITLGIAMGLVILVIYLFLGNVRSTLVPALTVPISLIASMTALYALGFTVNLLTLLALVLAIGLVVDDAIVVLENITRRVQMGEAPLLAAFRGARQVGFAVIATTLVLVSVFVPLGFLSGNLGRLFTEFAFAMAAAVGFSSIVALSLSPMLCSKLLKNDMRPNWLNRQIDNGFQSLANGYRRLLEALLGAPPLAKLGALAALFAFVFAGMFLFNEEIPSELAPREDRGAFFVIMQGPEGATFEYSRRYMRAIEDILMDINARGEAERVLVRTPGFGAQATVNSGIGIVVLEEFRERERGGHEIMGEVAGRVGQLPGIRAFPVMRSGLVRSFGQPVQFVIGGSTYGQLVEWRNVLLEEARTSGILVRADSDYRETRPQVRVEIDRTRAADLGVSVQQIGRTLETMLGERRVTTYLDRGEEYDVILRAREEDRNSASDLSNIYVRSERTGALIPLSNLVALREVAEPGELNRFNRLRSITISANIAPGYTQQEALEFLQGVVRDRLNNEPSVDYKGESREFMESSAAILFTIGFALVVVFLVLAAQFESWIHPLIIMFTVPLAIFGALGGIYFFDGFAGLIGTRNIYTDIGFVMLIGLAAKNGILIVEFINQLRDDGIEFTKAILDASQTRLRPIVMTALSTAMGAIPLVLASGAGAESRQSIGLVIFSGVTVATFFTLFVVPVFYSLIGGFSRSPKELEKRIETLAAQEDAAAPSR